MNPTSEPPPPPTAFAGLVLAAPHSARWRVIPPLFLVQLAVIVAGGMLIDTFVVRSLQVPGGHPRHRPRHVVAMGAARGARGRRRRRAG